MYCISHLNLNFLGEFLIRLRYSHTMREVWIANRRITALWWHFECWTNLPGSRDPCCHVCTSWQSHELLRKRHSCVWGVTITKLLSGTDSSTWYSVKKRQNGGHGEPGVPLGGLRRLRFVAHPVAQHRIFLCDSRPKQSRLEWVLDGRQRNEPGCSWSQHQCIAPQRYLPHWWLQRITTVLNFSSNF